MSGTMKNKPNLFDSLRVKPEAKKREGIKHPPCEWRNCDNPAPHKAPKGRDAEGEFYHFCVDHVREYNKSYNYFNGMSDDQQANFRKDSETGHRPTWKMGVNSWGEATTEAGEAHGKTWEGENPYDKIGQRSTVESRQTPYKRKLKPLEKKALDVFELGHGATSSEIKSQYKKLVKTHHPDVNGGDRSSEERLSQVITAYNTLKSAGYC